METAEPKQRTESLYFRGSAKLRDDAEQFGLDHGMTLSSALAFLVARGLQATLDEPSIKALEEQVQQLSQSLAVLQERDRNWSAIFSSLQGQLRTLKVGRCPACHRDVTAFDQMLATRCPWAGCERPLQQVERAEEFPPALAGLLGAIGGLLFGIAANSGASATGVSRIA